MILPHLRTAVLAAFPGLDAPKKAFFRVVRDIAGRLNLQPVAAAADQTKDLAAVEVCPGVPGVTSDPTPGETPIVAFVGADGVPYVIARAAEGMPGHTPIEVRHDATSAIRMISKAASSAAKVYVGSATAPLAKSAPVDATKAALVAFTTAVAATPTLPGIVAAAATMQTALNAIPSAATTKLEAQ
jgi:hypothetical protein